LILRNYDDFVQGNTKLKWNAGYLTSFYCRPCIHLNYKRI